MTNKPTHTSHNRLRNRLLRTLLVALLCPIIASCDSSTEPASDKMQVRINVDWSGYGKDTPTGMTVICHNNESGEHTAVTDNNISCATPLLSPGNYHATVFNLTVDEFANINFRGLESATTAEAYAAESDVPQWYATPVANNSYIAGQPEWLATDMIRTTIASASNNRLPDTEVIGTLHPKNIIYTLHITIHTENISNLRAVRGAISGLANGRQLATDRPNSNDVTVTHIIGSDSWTRHSTSSTPDLGILKAEVRCFGLPRNHRGTSAENILELHALLADGKTVKRYNFHVGDLISETSPSQDRRGDNLDLNLELRLSPSLPPATDNGGMDIWLDDWDEEADFDVPIQKE